MPKPLYIQILILNDSDFGGHFLTCSQVEFSMVTCIELLKQDGLEIKSSKCEFPGRGGNEEESGKDGPARANQHPHH